MPLITRVINPDLPETIGAMNTADIRNAIAAVVGGRTTSTQIRTRFSLTRPQLEEFVDLVGAVQAGWLDVTTGMSGIPAEALADMLTEVSEGFITSAEVALYFEFTNDEQQQFDDMVAVVQAGTIPNGPYAGRTIAVKDFHGALRAGEMGVPKYTHEFTCDRLGIVQWKYSARGGVLSGAGRGWVKQTRQRLPRVSPNGP